MSDTPQSLPGSTEPSPVSPELLRGLVAALILIAAGIIVYQSSFSIPFIFDDHNAIPNNPYIRQIWPLTEALKSPPQDTTAGRPIVSFSLAVNYQLGGVEVWGYHAFNLIIHLANALLLYGIQRRSLQRPQLAARFATAAPWLALAVSLLWVVHPLQTETVAYIIQRTELLFTFFYLATLYALIRGSQAHDHDIAVAAAWYALALLACALGMGTKEVMVTAPLFALLYDRALLAGSFAQAFRRRWHLYLGLFATWGILAWLVAQTPRSETVGFSLGVHWLDYLRTQAQVVVFYLRLSIWPTGLSISHDWPLVTTWGPAILPGSIILILLALTAWALIRRPALALPGLLFFFILGPTSSFIPITTEIVAERRMYLPLAGVLVLLIAALYIVLRQAAGLRGRALAATFTLVTAALAITLAITSVARLGDYHSEITIFEDALAKNPRSVKLLNSVAGAYLDSGQPRRAIDLLREAHQIKPTFIDTWFNLGNAQMALKNNELAEAAFRQAIDLVPIHNKAHLNLATVLLDKGDLDQAAFHANRAMELRPEDWRPHVTLGAIAYQRDEMDLAASHFAQALTLNPYSPEALLNLGMVMSRRKQFRHAVTLLDQAALFAPNDADIHHELALALAQTGEPSDSQRAVASLQRAIQLSPANGPMHDNLGQMLARGGDIEAAALAFDRAVELMPQRLATRNNYAMTLLLLNRVEEAVTQYEAALAIDASSAITHHQLSLALEQLRRYGEAIEEARQAEALRPDWPAARHHLTWMVATSPTSETDELAWALQRARAANTAAEGQDPMLLDLQAVAEARAGHFDVAVTLAQQALSLADTAGQRALADQIQSRLALYRQRQPFIQER